ncbi:MAG TPA: LysR family transcriptional regulator, partial [Denitromonas sp.]|nr:LysR family transcriptional regulator [Denitromonas sp.]
MLDAIDTAGSFAAAARQLHRVPSALTHAVRRLEDDLGYAIFE